MTNIKFEKNCNKRTDTITNYINLQNEKAFSIFLIALFAFAGAQETKETANRFFYELTFKPKKDSAKLDKLITILDITPKNQFIRIIQCLLRILLSRFR